MQSRVIADSADIYNWFRVRASTTQNQAAPRR